LAGKKSVIEPGVDKLVKLVSDRKKISVKEAAKELGVSVSSIEEWADFLEEEGIISIQTQFATVYLVEKKIGKKELKEKVKAVKGEKEDFMRRVESSINALQRDHEEIKLIDSEFRKIRSLLEDNFSKLSKKLEKLEDFRKSHREMEMKRKEIEQSYEKKINDLERKLKDDHKEYEKIIASVEAELERIGDEKKHLDQMKASEKELEGKVSEINQMISQVKSEIDKGNRQLDIDEERLKKSEESAKKIKDHIQASSKELDSVADQVKGSHKELRSMEQEFIKDVESLGRGDLQKIGPYKESQELIKKFRTFFTSTKQVEELILNAEKEEDELREHFEALLKKAQAFSVMTSAPDVKKDLDSLRKELLAIESRKTLLGTQLKKLRGMMRAVAK